MAKNRKARRKALLRKKKPLVSGHAKAAPLAVAKALAAHKAKEEADRLAVEKAEEEERKAAARVIIDPAVDWYILQTYPEQEDRVERVLAGDQEDRPDGRPRRLRRCAIYRPRQVVQRVRKSKVWITERHVMPRHMFIGVGRRTDPRSVLVGIDGAYGLMTSGERFIRIEPQSLQAFADVIVEVNEPLRGLGSDIIVVGQELKVTKGAYAQFTATVQSPEKAGTVLVEIRILGKEVRLRLPLDHLQAA